MNKLIFLFVFALFIFGGCSSQSIPEAILSSTVSVRTPTSQGTGIIIRSNKIGGLEETYILTAKHVVEKEKKIILITNEDHDRALILITKFPKRYDISYDITEKCIVLIEKTFYDFVRVKFSFEKQGLQIVKELDARVKCLSTDKDLALLRFVSKETPLQQARMGSINNVEFGGELWSCGFALSELTLTRGILGQKIHPNTEFGLYTGGVIGGMSGGGVFDKNGLLVGVVVVVKGKVATGPIWHLCGFEMINKEEIDLLLKADL